LGSPNVLACGQLKSERPLAGALFNWQADHVSELSAGIEKRLAHEASLKPLDCKDLQ